MIDLHTHLLPGIDDGSKSLEQTMELLKKAKENGVTDLVMTSHFARFRHYTVGREETEKLFQTVVEKTKKENINITLYLGNELDYEDGMLDLLKNKEVNTIAGSRYVLVDFGLKEYDVDDVIYELVIKGYKPIIAHPERYRYVSGVDKMIKWRKTGALLQMNASSLFGHRTTKKQAKMMLKHQLVDLVASDTHRDYKTLDDMLKCKQYMDKKMDSVYVKKVFNDNPKKVLSNDEMV